jgi:regulator of protease activity HflC (stomatin/prohibitin superfamily)
MNPLKRGIAMDAEAGRLAWQAWTARPRGDFRFGPLNALALVAIFVAGLSVHLNVHDFSVNAVLLALGSALIIAFDLWLWPSWGWAVILGTGDCLLIYLLMRPTSESLLVAAIAAVLVAPAFQIADQWERVVVLRFGRFRALKPAGVFLLFPVIDRAAQFVDQRIRVTDFSAETTLTSDTVPVNVDAIAFWMVWDAKKAVLEVEAFRDAVVLSAQTALRNAIGKHDLAVLLSERDRLGHEIQKVLDEKTNGWGITTQAVEIRDIIIPKDLEDAMSRQAQAERERQSRIILGTAETEIAEKFAKASEHYLGNPVALHLRAMNMVYEGLRQKGSMIIVPSTAVETMGLGAIGGLTAFGQTATEPGAAPAASAPAPTTTPAAAAAPAPKTA